MSGLGVGSTTQSPKDPANCLHAQFSSSLPSHNLLSGPTDGVNEAECSPLDGGRTRRSDQAPEYIDDGAGWASHFSQASAVYVEPAQSSPQIIL